MTKKAVRAESGLPGTPGSGGGGPEPMEPKGSAPKMGYSCRNHQPNKAARQRRQPGQVPIAGFRRNPSDDWRSRELPKRCPLLEETDRGRHHGGVVGNASGETEKG